MHVLNLTCTIQKPLHIQKTSETHFSTLRAPKKENQCFLRATRVKQAKWKYLSRSSHWESKIKSFSVLRMLWEAILMTMTMIIIVVVWDTLSDKIWKLQFWNFDTYNSKQIFQKMKISTPRMPRKQSKKNNEIMTNLDSKRMFKKTFKNTSPRCAR